MAVAQTFCAFPGGKEMEAVPMEKQSDRNE